MVTADRSISISSARGALDAQALVWSLDRAFGPVERLSSGEQTLYLRVAGVTVSCFQLPYPLLFPTTPTPYHRVRALTYFDDAEAEPMPDLLRPLAWTSVREYFIREAKHLLATELGRE
jgi:hypothetical protein